MELGTPAVVHQPVHEAPPFGIESRKLVMWLFIVADAITFAAILFGYGFLRMGSTSWTRPFAFSPTIVNAMVMTAILLTSSLTMTLAMSAAQLAERVRALRWLSATIVLGASFAILHLLEWSRMFSEGWSPSHNPSGGTALVGGTFFGVTGLHLLHVIGGIVALTVVATKYARGRMHEGHIETTALYWHFVDLVWMFVFPLLYLLNAR
jgi:heme/copper-type cytochrome/quinol oxidase subunit 3